MRPGGEFRHPTKPSTLKRSVALNLDSAAALRQGQSAMQLIFRKLQAGDVPASGELLIQASDAAARDELALLALEHGIAAFPQGAAPLHTLVVTAGPTLDDMLAALIVEERLAGRPLPEGLQPFARYANLRRTGLTPSS